MGRGAKGKTKSLCSRGMCDDTPSQTPPPLDPAQLSAPPRPPPDKLPLNPEAAQPTTTNKTEQSSRPGTRVTFQRETLADKPSQNVQHNTGCRKKKKTQGPNRTQELLINVYITQSSCTTFSSGSGRAFWQKAHSRTPFRAAGRGGTD